MNTEIVKNPEELQVISNPNKPNKTMAKSKSNIKEGLSEWGEQAKSAAYILGGQAIGAQLNAVIVPATLKEATPSIQQIAKILIPSATGVALALTKNSHARSLSLGFGVQGVLELIKFVMPDWSPQQGFSDGSGFIFTDENGQPQKAVVNAQGQLTAANGEPLKLGSGKAKATEHSPEVESALDGFDSGYVEDETVEWV